MTRGDEGIETFPRRRSLMTHTVTHPTGAAAGAGPSPRSPMFIVCGESLMDVSPASDTPTGVLLDARVGGSPFNVAIGLARLAQPVAFLSSVSRDFLGDRLLRALAAEGVDLSTVQRVDAPTTLGLVGLNAQ